MNLFLHKIDRSDYFKKSISKIWVNSIDHIPTNEKYKVIRSEFMKSLGFNEISKRIPDIWDIFERLTCSWREGEQPNLILPIQEITFEVINHLLFGSDSFQIMKNWKYYEPNGTETTLEFGMFFRKIVDDWIKNYFSLWYKLFPFLADHSLMQPFKTDKKNIDNLNLYLKEFIRLTKDNQSGLTKMIENGLLSIEEITESIKSFLGAGSETSARCVCSIVYYLNKYPKWYDKLIQELKSWKVLKEDGSLDCISKEAISDCDYLGYVVKEALRIDPPAVESICYKSLQDIEICGIPIPKK